MSRNLSFLFLAGDDRRLYDRTSDEITLPEIERIAI
jgi:hypothetical protein